MFFEEKQYLGLNKFSLVRRTILAMGCFVAYYWSENPKPVELELIDIGPYPASEIQNSGQIFFLLGLVLLVFSIVLIFILHMHTVVSSNGIYIRGLWSKKRIFIPFSDVASVKRVRVKETIFSKPVFNLHSKGKIRFYSRGKEGVEVTLKDGAIYRLGTQRSLELATTINSRLIK